MCPVEAAAGHHDPPQRVDQHRFRPVVAGAAGDVAADHESIRRAVGVVITAEVPVEAPVIVEPPHCQVQIGAVAADSRHDDAPQLIHHHRVAGIVVLRGRVLVLITP